MRNWTQLSATHVLDGSVRRSGARVRISTELVECASEVSLWCQRFDRDLSDIFALLDEVASAVARALIMGSFREEVHTSNQRLWSYFTLTA